MPSTCTDQKNRFDDAKEAMDDAGEELTRASQDYESAGGVFDDSTAWDVAGVVGAAAVCLIPVVGWGACGAAVVAGAGTVIASEVGRSQEIDAAETKLNREWEDYWKAFSRLNERLSDFIECQLHEQQKAQPTP